MPVTVSTVESSILLVDVVENSRRDANREDRQLADRFVPGTPRNIDHGALMTARFSAAHQAPPQDRDQNRRHDPTQTATDGRRDATRHGHRGWDATWR